MLNLLVSSKLPIKAIESNFWVKFLKTYLPQFPVPNAVELLDSLEAALLQIKEQIRTEGLTPVAFGYVKKIDEDFFCITLGMTREIKYVFLHCKKLEEPESLSSSLHEFCVDSIKAAFDDYRTVISIVIMDILNYDCDEFYHPKDVGYIVSRPIHRLYDSLRKPVIDSADITDENSPVNIYRAAIQDYQNCFNNSKFSFGEAFTKLIELIDSKILHLNSRWLDHVLPFINPVTLGFIYMIPSERFRFESDDFLQEFKLLINIRELLKDFYFCAIPEGDASKYFSYYKELSEEFQYANAHFLNKGAQIYWEKLRPVYYGLSEFALDLLRIPATPPFIDVDELYTLISASNFDFDDPFVIYRILVFLQK